MTYGFRGIARILRLFFLFLPIPVMGQAPQPAIPDAATLLKDVVLNQHKLDHVRESYTYKESVTTEEIDGKGAVKKIEHEEQEVFFVNGHEIHRTVVKEGKPLDGEALEKENTRVTKEVDRAEKTPMGQPMKGEEPIRVSRLLEIMEISNPRIEEVNGRPAYAYDFAGKRNAETHNMVEDVSKKIAGTIWIDAKDHQVARLDSHFLDNFHVGGGLVANIQKGTSFHFEQALVKNELWLPTNVDIHFAARVLLLKGIRQHIVIRDHDYERFKVEAEQKGATVR